ncbi:MAG: DUF1579 domain-containing protein [Phycisphaerales bacterium]
MKLCIPCAMLLGGVIGAVAVTQIAAGPDDKKTQPPADMQMDPQMKAMMDQCIKDGMPGEPHKHMADMVGTWNAECKMYMDPTKEPTITTGKMVSKAMWDGRFIVGDFTGTFMGKPFSGQMTWGYNNVEKRYESTWRDSMGTATMFMTGTASPDWKTYTSTGDCAMNMPDGQKMAFKSREVIQVISPDKHTMTMYRSDPTGQGEMKEMEITYTRAK